MGLTPLLVPAATDPLGWSGLAVLLALTAAVLFGLATVRQHAGVQHLAGSSDLRRLVRAPGWLAGAAQSLVASTLHLTALALAPIALVQPLGVLAVPVAVVAHARAARQRPAARSLVAALLSVLGTAGLTLTLLLAPAVHAAPSLPGLTTVALLPAAALLVPILGLVRGSSGPTARAAASAVSGAVLFGLTPVLVRTAATAWTAGQPAVALTAVAGALVVAGAGLVSVQQAYRTGSPPLVICCLTLVDPLVATAGAAVLLHEAPALTGTTAGVAVLSSLLAAGGVVLLTRDHPTVALSRPVPGAEPGGPSRPTPQSTDRPTLTRSTS